MIAIYLANPSHAMVSPEQTSRAFNLQAATGDYTPSMYTQGELLGAMLDLMIRDGSAGRRSLDDAMHALAARFMPVHGFTSTDLENAIVSACACDAHSFFETYVRAARVLDFDKWLGLIGLRSAVTWAPARANDGSLSPDVRVSSCLLAGEVQPRLQVWFLATVWAGPNSTPETGSRHGTAWPSTMSYKFEPRRPASPSNAMVGRTVAATSTNSGAPVKSSAALRL